MELGFVKIDGDVTGREMVRFGFMIGEIGDGATGGEGGHAEDGAGREDDFLVDLHLITPLMIKLILNEVNKFPGSSRKRRARSGSRWFGLRRNEC